MGVAFMSETSMAAIRLMGADSTPSRTIKRIKEAYRCGLVQTRHSYLPLFALDRQI